MGKGGDLKYVRRRVCLNIQLVEAIDCNLPGC
jgi:hypothetical protein